MSFKTKSIIKNLLFDILPFSFFALIMYGLFMLASNTSGVLSLSLYFFASLGLLVLIAVFIISITSKDCTDNIKYSNDGIELYRKGVGYDFIPWNNVTDVEIRRLPKGNIRAYIFTDKYCNAYTTPMTRNDDLITNKNDALRVRCTDNLLETIYKKRPDIVIKHYEDVQRL